MDIPAALPRWKVLLVNGDADLVALLGHALQHLTVEGHALQVLEAGSAAHAQTLLGEQADVALLVMVLGRSDEQASLALVRHLREDLGNRALQVWLLAGGPGCAGLRELAAGYAIDGCSLRSELNADSAFASVYAALRAYRARRELEGKMYALELKVRSLAQWEQIFTHAEWGVCVCSADGQVLQVCNPAFARQLGYEVAEVLSLPVPAIFALAERETLAHHLHSARDLGHHNFQSWLLRKNASTFPGLVDITSVKDAQGQVLYLVLNVQDITSRIEAQMQVSFMAYHDRLTGLANRALFFDRFSQAISQARRNHRRVALLFLDLDKFKPINDAYGHSAGDLVLKATAERLLACVRAVDTVARVGGDEFVVIIGGMDQPEDAAPVAGKLVEAVAKDIALGGGRVCQVGVSIGISVYPDHGTEMDTLLVHADAAMYQSKFGGKGKYGFFSADEKSGPANGEWLQLDAAHRVGFALIDTQHQHLVDLINRLNQAIKANTDPAGLTLLFDEIAGFVVFHFKTEQDLMDSHHYPGYEAHALAHQNLLAETVQLREGLYQGGDLYVLQSIKDWLLHHIVAEDMPLAEFLRQPTQNTQSLLPSGSRK